MVLDGFVAAFETLIEKETTMLKLIGLLFLLACGATAVFAYDGIVTFTGAIYEAVTLEDALKIELTVNDSTTIVGYEFQ